MSPQLLTLPSNRTLEYNLTGSPSGFPLIWLHGTPSGYPAIPALIHACEKKNLKLITFSRSGYGKSSRNAERKIVDEVQDVKALMNHLGIEKCFVGGWSGGGAPALACAARLEGCLGACVVAAVAPFEAEGLDWLEGQGEDNVAEFNATKQGEAVLRKFCMEQSEEMLKADVAGIVQAMSSLLPPIDKKALTESDEIGPMLVETIHIGLEKGVDGWVDDDLAMMKPWGFELSEIQCPVFLYQGSEDKMVPYGHGKWLAERIPKGILRAHLEEGEGHISIFMGRVEGMLDELLGVPH